SGIINRNLATAAQQLGIGMMLGSQRVMIDDPAAAVSFDVRQVGHHRRLYLRQTDVADQQDVRGDLAAALDRVGADGLAVHTNPLQEAMQHNGDTDFSGSMERLRA
ncbi:type 2 isopentenyl-diphosphate Delta-isomerase, partial [Mycobacterium sp. ITM-2017-0098]